MLSNIDVRQDRGVGMRSRVSDLPYVIQEEVASGYCGDNMKICWLEENVLDWNQRPCDHYCLADCGTASVTLCKT